MTSQRGYTLSELMIMIVFLAFISTIAARAIEMAPRPTTTTPPAVASPAMLDDVFD